MTTANLINTYNSLKASFNAETEKYNEIISVQIPKVDAQIKDVQFVMTSKRQALKQAVTADSVRKAKFHLAETEERLSDLTQLKENLSLQASVFERQKDGKQLDLTRARIDMWTSIRNDLFASLALSPEITGALERLVTASGNAEYTPFNINGSLGIPVQEKYGSIDGDRMRDITGIMMTEMGII